MPFSGKQLDPVASIFITNSNKRDVVLRSRSKKIPPKNGLKKLEMILSVNPTSCIMSVQYVCIYIYMHCKAFHS